MTPIENRLSSEQLTAATTALDHAAYLHEQWTNGVYASLVCGLPPDERDLAVDAHRHCAFGQWYYAQDGTELGSQPGFIAVVPAHEQMHRAAALILRATQDGRTIEVAEYEDFVNALTHLRLQIASLRLELQDAIIGTDPLTGAANRVGLLPRLRAQHELAKRTAQPCCIAMIDIDWFKQINDRYGHAAGDTVLIRVVRYVLMNLRPYDQLYRHGGEEFLLVAPGTDLASGLAAVERLREGLAQSDIECADGIEIRVTVSIGVTVLDPNAPVEVSIDRADRALYAAKAAGRNRSCVWEHDQQTTASARPLGNDE